MRLPIICPPEMMEQYSRLFDQAEQETETEPVTLKRIREARLPLVIAEIQIAGQIPLEHLAVFIR